VSPSLRRCTAAAAICGLGYMLFESQWVRRTDVTIGIPDLPSPLDGLTIALLADFHAAFRTSFNLRATSRAVELARAARTDLVLLAGDLAGGPGNLDRMLALLDRLEAPLGVYAVYGNHDRAESKVPWVSGVDLSAVEDHGVRLLVDEVATIPHRGARIQICGIDEFKHGHGRLDRVLPQLDLGPDTLRLLLSHYAQAALAVDPGIFALTLSGDTHGGQICLPTWKGTAMLSQPRAEFKDGLYVREGRRIYVTRGVGTSLLPFRFLAPPEIVVITLVQGDELAERSATPVSATATSAGGAAADGRRSAPAAG